MQRKINVTRRACTAFMLTASAALCSCAWWPVGELEIIPYDATWKDLSPHQSRFLNINGTRLNYLDWSGDGSPIVLVHGLGDDPHIFDDLATVLRQRHRVIAYARRGHGRSDATMNAYDLTTLVEDLRQVIQRLQLGRVHLLGWSTGGNEVTEFAARYPDKVAKVIYLEAGYDWSDTALLQRLTTDLGSTAPMTAELASFEAYRAWYIERWLGVGAWPPGLEAHLRNSTRIDAAGHVETIPSPAVLRAMFRALASSPQRYREVRAPALMLYASSFLPAGNERVRELNAFMQESQTVNALQASLHLRDVRMQRIDRTTHRSIGFMNIGALALSIEAFLSPL